MPCFLYNLPIVTLVLWVLSLQRSCAPILILSNHHARLHKLFLFSGDGHGWRQFYNFGLPKGDVK